MATIIETHAFTLDQLIAYRSSDIILDTLPVTTIEVSAELAAFLELVDDSELTEDGDGDELLEEDD